MPSFVPRSEPIRKAEQLSYREFELIAALTKGISEEKLIQAAEKYRTAKLLYLKARIHVIKEKNFKSISHNDSSKKLEAEMEKWTKKSVEDILNEIKSTQ